MSPTCSIPLCPDTAVHFVGRKSTPLCEHHYRQRQWPPPAQGTKCSVPGCPHQATEWFCPGCDAGSTPMCAPHAKAAGSGWW